LLLASDMASLISLFQVIGHRGERKNRSPSTF
jgi:hypothetical protein